MQQWGARRPRNSPGAQPQEAQAPQNFLFGKGDYSRSLTGVARILPVYIPRLLGMRESAEIRSTAAGSGTLARVGRISVGHSLKIRAL